MNRVLILFATVLVAAAPGQAGQLTSKQAVAARKIYVGKCAKCHKFYDPKKYSDAQWELWMNRMSEKSKLKPEQEELVKRYLEEYRAGKRPKVR